MKRTVESLKTFEQDVADAFNRGEIRAPVHLSGGNEEQLIDYFETQYRPGDFICSTWRSHYHCLLAGVPPERLRADIMAGRSITLCYPDHRIVSSAIVGGILPIAVGLALAIKRRRGPERVHALVGDMAARTGAFAESFEYAFGHALPVTFVIEDNGKSVGTPTNEVWGIEPRGWLDDLGCDTEMPARGGATRVYRYHYNLPWPHSGAGQWIRF